MKKGFTLIELLAVIVILAIIALIASPIIIGLIDDARKESFKNSAYGITKAGEIFYAKNMMNDPNEEVTFTYDAEGETSFPEGKKLDYNGSKPNSGEVKINKNGEIALAVHNGTYCAKKTYYESEVIISNKSEEECKIFICEEDLLYDSRDGQKYATVKIGEQCWMAENLKYTGNGCLGKTWSDETIDACKKATEVELTANDSHRGWLQHEVWYQWGAAMNGNPEDTQGLCPDGWYIPTDAEWKILEGTVDSTYGIGNLEWDDSGHRGNDAGTKLKAKPTIWEGTDTVGFNAKPAGGRYTDGSLFNVGSVGSWWTSSVSGSDAWIRYLYSGDSDVFRYYNSQASGSSVRCLLGQ